MKIFVVPNLRKQNAKEITKQAVNILNRHGATVLLDCKTAQQLNIEQKYSYSHQEAIQQCHTIVTIGGDGTILKIAREIQPYSKPLLGINLGRLGFLATCEISEMEYKLSRLVKGDFLEDKRMMIEAKVLQPNIMDKTIIALNDIVICKGVRTQTIGLEVFCDGISMGYNRGDGLIMATPTGSTAYSLSAGGAVVDAAMEGILLTPICSHTLQSPPMIFSSHRKLLIKMHCESNEPIYLSADGTEPIIEINCKSQLEVFCSKSFVVLVQFSTTDQLEAIDKKLIRKITV